MDKKTIFLLAAFCLVTFFVNLGALPTDIMESRNIVTAREMVSDGNWLVPTMNGELRLEKPPLPTWVAGAVELLRPDSLAAQRAAAGVMGCMWTLYLFLLTRYISRRNDLAATAVVVFLTSYNLVLMGRSATWDIYCHAFMMGAIYYLTRGLFENRHVWRRFSLAGLFLGLSFLSKGPVSFYALLLPYLIALLATARADGSRRIAMKGKWGALAAMVAVAIVVGGWWYAWLLAAHPLETAAVIHKESAAWSGHNVRPWYYYWRFFLEMGVWALLMLAALAVPYWKRHITLRRDYLWAVTWAIASIVLLSLMPEKKTRYLLPSLAPCAITVACLIVHIRQARPLDGFSRCLYMVQGLTATVVVAAMPVLVWLFAYKKGMFSLAGTVFTCLFLLAVAAWLLAATLRRRPLRFVGGVAALFAFAVLFLLRPIGNAFGNPEAHGIALTRQDRRLDALPFYHNAGEPLRIELVYEAHRKILPYDFSDTTKLKAALPCALVSRKWAAEELTPEALALVDTVAIGTFDDNKHPKSNKHYTSDFLNHVTLLKAKHPTAAKATDRPAKAKAE